MNSIRSRVQRAMAAIVAVTLLLVAPLAIPARPADAATPPVAGYVWANNPTSPKYTPYAETSFNGADPRFTNAVGRNSLGVYTVTFPGMAVTGGIAHATAFGSGTQQCKVKSWGPVASGSPDLRVLVKCFDVNGALADSMFMASFTAQSATNTQTMAYLLADRPAAASYTANPTFSYNSKGVLNTITRTGVGPYIARLGWLGSSGGHVQVTAYGDGSERCKVAGWVPVSVGCHFRSYLS